ncbi:MAG: glycosyltransferase, partial [Phascolarctobacterium sp.]|uniref:glycosyltransferase n=1 Tax=Phascolarctobacterium sp. TaxID=2049039 RepID=UPI0026005801
WHIYGEGKELYKLGILELIKKNGLLDKIILMGNKKNMYDLYADYSFLVMTSRHEGLPMALLEAKAKKLPLVSFDIETGPSDIIRNDMDGFLVPAFDTEAMSCKICELIENPELRQKFSDNSQGNLEKFSKEKIMRQWCDLIERVE